jgi:hypothetical protein
MLDPFVICCVPTASSVEALKTELIFTLGAMESARPLLGVGKLHDADQLRTVIAYLRAQLAVLSSQVTQLAASESARGRRIPILAVDSCFGRHARPRGCAH